MNQPGRERTRIGIIGAGVWATQSHLPSLQRRAHEIELVGACRLGRHPLDELGRRYGFRVLTEDYRDVLAADIDYCIVSSPPALHYEHARAALLAGCHVLIEKPVTINPAEAWDLVDLATERGRHVVVAFGWNFMPTYQRAKSLWEIGGVGQVEHILVHMASGIRELLSGEGLSSTGNPADEADVGTYTDPALAGGGYSQTQFPHALGFLLGLTGITVADVFARGWFRAGGAVETHNAAVLGLTGGGIGLLSGASFHQGAQSNRHQLEMRIFGDRGQMHVDLERDRVWLWREDGLDVEAVLPTDAGLYHCNEPPLALLDLITGRRHDNPAPLELGARTVAVLDALGRSIRSGAVESVVDPQG